MGQNTFEILLRHVILSCVLDVHPKQLAIQTLRLTGFIIHESLGLSTWIVMRMAGHSSTMTHMTYILKLMHLLSSASTSILVWFLLDSLPHPILSKYFIFRKLSMVSRLTPHKSTLSTNLVASESRKVKD